MSRPTNAVAAFAIAACAGCGPHPLPVEQSTATETAPVPRSPDLSGAWSDGKNVFVFSTAGGALWVTAYDQLCQAPLASGLGVPSPGKLTADLRAEPSPLQRLSRIRLALEASGSTYAGTRQDVYAGGYTESRDETLSPMASPAIPCQPR